MINKKDLKAPKKKINNRRKSRELIMKGVYRALVNQFDINQIKKDIQDDPDFIRADEAFYLEIMDGVFDNFDVLTDTPECAVTDDANSNGVADTSECADGLNIMFWNNELGSVKEAMTALQKRVIFYSPIAKP